MFYNRLLSSEEGELHNRRILPEACSAAKLSVLSPQITPLWNNLDLACSDSLLSPCSALPLPPALSSHLSSPELTCCFPSVVMLCIFHFPFCFSKTVCFSSAYSPCTSGLTLCLSSLQPRSILDPKLLGLQTGG